MCLDYVILANRDILQDSNFKLLFCLELENRLIINCYLSLPLDWGGVERRQVSS
jgi:hypothetical protein